MKLNPKRDYTLASLTFGATLLFSCSENSTLQQMPDDIANHENAITATITPTNPSRTCIDGDPAVTGQAGLLWTPGDALGVFASATSSQVQYVKQNQIDDEAEATFVAASGAKAIDSPAYAYYPYSADNNGRTPSDLLGLVPMEQKMTSGNIDGDYKIGRPTATPGHFTFTHLFSLVRVAIDLNGTTDLEGDIVESATLTVNRGTIPVPITGHFNFDATATTPTYTLATSVATSETMGEAGLPTNSTANRLVMNWEGNTSTGAEVGYASIFPNVKTGDILNFEIITDRHIASFSVTSKVDFESERLYNFPLTLSNIKDNAGNPVEITITSRPGTTDPDPEPETFTFTCATYNVDGLPVFNSDGPGDSGTTALAQRINSDSKWDFFCVSEDFGYDSQLTSALTNYDHGTFRGSVGMAQLTQTADTDGLNMFWKNSIGITVSNETFVEYKDKEGGLSSGANTCIKKGFRYYLVTFANGAEIDVYITHMNTYSGSSIDENSNKYVAAVHSQLKQVRDYILDNMRANKRPAIFMGDTNMRYTRHKLQEYFMDNINAMEGYSVVDPWIDLTWNNDFSTVGGSNYPLYGGKSLMVSDATGTDASTDVIISEADGGLQKGEIVDKIFYINCKDSKAQLKAKSYLRDTSFKKSNGSPLADHYPVVVEFEYTSK